jgi:hypothetical protein
MFIVGPILFWAALRRKRDVSGDRVVLPRYPFDPDEYPGLRGAVDRFGGT